MFIAVIGRAALLATVLHELEAGLWAVAYRGLDALPDSRSAMLYSLSAMSSYGHANLYLRDQWQLMGAFEALNGMLLFGLTTASLFAMIREVWDMERRENAIRHLNCRRDRAESPFTLSEEHNSRLAYTEGGVMLLPGLFLMRS